ncbi:M48 family metallopeptidase [Methanosarcina mazei]|nr:SprT family zinc-dependent metalloprotease [Methanosarcina mazei]
MEQIRIGNTLIDYRLIYSSRQKTIELAIDLDSGFTVRAPASMSKEEVSAYLQQKANWIITNLDKMNEVIRNETRKEFVSGEKFLYKGKRYRLKVTTVNEEVVPSLSFTHSKFIVQVPANIPEYDYPRIIQPLFIDFYHQKAEKILTRRAKKYLLYFENKPSLIKVQSLKNKWGNCSKTNQLRFNWRVVMAKMSIIDYVVVHELCHTKYKDHSKAFWNEVQKILPDYEERKEWLRINGDLLKI